jgi:hypothetical protein
LVHKVCLVLKALMEHKVFRDLLVKSKVLRVLVVFRVI